MTRWVNPSCAAIAFRPDDSRSCNNSKHQRSRWVPAIFPNSACESPIIGNTVPPPRTGQPISQPWATPRQRCARQVAAAQRANGSPSMLRDRLARWAAWIIPKRFPWALPRAGRIAGPSAREAVNNPGQCVPLLLSFAQNPAFRTPRTIKSTRTQYFLNTLSFPF